MLRTCLRYAPLALLAALPFIACAPDDKKAGLVVAVQTDMSIPKDIDAVEIEVSTYGNVLLKNVYDVGEGGLNIPATLTILPGDEKGQPVTIRVISYQGGSNGTARTLRKVITTVPDDREALLRMPIQWLCVGQVENEGTENHVSTCPEEGESCVAGSCVTDKVDLDTLPDFSKAALFGGSADGAGVCFDTVPCMAAEMQWLDPALFDLESCTLPVSALNGDPVLGADAEAGDVEQMLNFALSFPPDSDGICGKGEAEPFGCFVPLDEDAAIGWSLDGDNVKFPTAVCEHISQLDAKASLVASPACQTKTPEIPTCGSWSSVGGSKITVTLPPPTAGAAGSPNGGGTGSVGNLNYSSVPFVAPNGNVSVDSPALTGTITATYDSQCSDTTLDPMTFEGQPDLCTGGTIGAADTCNAGYLFNVLNADPSIIGLGFELTGSLPPNLQLVVHQGATEFCTPIQNGMNNILFRDLTQDCVDGGAQMVDPTFESIEIRMAYGVAGGGAVDYCLDKLSALVEP